MIFSDLLGTLKSTLRINKLTIDASALSVPRTLTLGDTAGTLSGTNLGDQTSQTVIAQRVSGSTYSTVQHIQDLFHSTGWTSGGAITDAGAGLITIVAGTGLIRATNSDAAVILFTDWAASSPANVVLTDAAINYIYVEYNAGTPRLIATTTERTDFNTNIYLAKIYRNGTTLHINNAVKYAVSDHAGKMITQMQASMPYECVSGSGVSASGTRNFAVTAGSFWNGLINFTTSSFDSSAAGRFTYIYRNGSGGFTEVATQSQINNTQYDNGTGTLATLSNNKYGVHWLYLETDGDITVMYGQGDYTLVEAQNSLAPSALPGRTQATGFLLGRIIIQKSATTFAQTESACVNQFATAAATEHNTLSGLQGGAASDYQHLTTAQLAVVAATSGTNTGDQASIVGITGTTAQFNTAITDGDLVTTAANTFTGNQTLSSAAINQARSNVTQHATTMDFWAAAVGNVLDGTGSAVTITAIANAPQAGASRDFYPITGTILTQGATFDIDGAANRTSVAGECWTFVAKSASTYRVFVRKADGRPLQFISNVIQATRAMDAASGNVSYTGFGFKPKTLHIIAVVDANSGISQGIATDTSEFATSKFGAAATNQNYVAGFIVYYTPDAAGTDRQSATVASIDADGFTLSWTRVGTTSTAVVQLLITATY